MARNIATVPAAIEHVFAVLAEPQSYGSWVVGSDRVRDADPGWPALGTRLHHRVSLGPLHIDDHTEVVAVAPPTRLVLQAHARPLGTARVDLRLEALDGERTQITMIEEPGDRLSRLLHNPILDFLLRVRNDVALKRLAKLAAARQAGAAVG